MGDTKPMSEERLEEIKCRLDRYGWDWYLPWLKAAGDDLVREVERLQKEVPAVRDGAR